MASLAGLGKNAIMSNSLLVNPLDPLVRVRRKDTTVHDVHLMAEHARVIEKDFPKYATRFLQFPSTYEYEESRLHGVDGFPAEMQATTNPEREWKKSGIAFAGEEKLYNMLVRTFTNTRGAFMWSGYKVENFVLVARETLDYDYKQLKQACPDKLDIALTDNEKDFYGITMSLDMGEFENDVLLFVDDLFKSKPSIDKSEAKAAVKATTSKPFLDRMADNQKNKYKDMVTKHLEKAFQTMKKNTLDKEEVRYSFQRYFLKSLKNTDEYDILLVDGTTRTFYHIEVKSYPVSGNIEAEKLKKAISNAEAQLIKGKCFIEKVLAPQANLSGTWTRVGMICLPSIPTRAVLMQKLGGWLDADQLKYILTEEELNIGDFRSALDLPAVAALASDYKSLISSVVGSVLVSYRCQEVNHKNEAEKELGKALKRVGKPNQVPDTLPPADEVNFSQMKKKPLSHISSIIYWNIDQIQLLNDTLKASVNISAYGTGKTLLLTSAARKAAEDPNAEVFFIPATSWDGINDNTKETRYILDINMEKMFEGTAVTVLNLKNFLKSNMSVMQKGKAALGLKTETIYNAMNLFIAKKGDKSNVRIYVDEVPITIADKKAAIAGEDSSLTRLLNTLLSGSAQVWVALRSGDLIDTAAGSGIQPSLSLVQLRTHLETKTGYKVVTLDKRVRNTALVGRSVPADVLSGYAGYSGHSFYSATVLPVASSHTVPGLRPVAILGDMGYNTRPDYPAICQAMQLSLAHLHLSSLPQDCVILCGAGISPKTLGEHLGPGAGVQVYHAGVDMYDGDGTATYLPSDHKAGQEDVVRKWLDGVGGCMVTHNTLFCGMEAATAIFISMSAEEPGVRSGLLRGVGRVAFLAGTAGRYGYKKEKLENYFHLIKLSYDELGDAEEGEVSNRS